MRLMLRPKDAFLSAPSLCERQTRMGGVAAGCSRELSLAMCGPHSEVVRVRLEMQTRCRCQLASWRQVVQCTLRLVSKLNVNPLLVQFKADILST